MKKTKFKIPKKNKGFTLVELIVVISLIIILSAIVGSKFIDIDIFKRSGDFEKTFQSLNFAQQLSQNQRRNIYINNNGNRLRLCYIESANLCPNNQSVLLDGKIYEAELNNNLGLSSNLFFTPSGQLNVVNLNIGFGSQSIVVYGNTGFIEKVINP